MGDNPRYLKSMIASFNVQETASSMRDSLFPYTSINTICLVISTIVCIKRKQPSFCVFFDRFQGHPMIYLTRELLNSPLFNLTYSSNSATTAAYMAGAENKHYYLLSGVHMAGLISFIFRPKNVCPSDLSKLIHGLTVYFFLIIR